MQKFISVGKFFFGVCMSLLIVTVGVYFTYMFYMTDQPVHNVFGVVGPAFVVFAFCLAFLVVHELVQELRSEAHTFEEYQDLFYAAYEERMAEIEGNIAADYVINSALEEKK